MDRHFIRFLFWSMTALYFLGTLLALAYDKLERFDFIAMLIVPVVIYMAIWDQHRMARKEFDLWREQFKGLGCNVDGSYFRKMSSSS